VEFPEDPVVHTHRSLTGSGLDAIHSTFVMLSSGTGICSVLVLNSLILDGSAGSDSGQHHVDGGRRNTISPQFPEAMVHTIAVCIILRYAS
jgi:hypothetical protein